MISINKIQVENLVKFFKDEISEHHNIAIQKLRGLLKNNHSLSRKEKSFLRLIIREFKRENFVSAPLNSIESLSRKIGEMPVTKKRRFAGKKKESYLKDEILKALDYQGKRATFYPKYFQRLGIKSCVYCNSQLTVVIRKEKGAGKNITSEYKAKFQVDHYFPKDKFPYLSIALFNLYPVCATCNLAKSNKTIDFKLYNDFLNTDIFQFVLNKVSKAKFLITRNTDDLKIEFKKIGDDNYIDIFNINEIYTTQKDIAEEIILKALAYNPMYRQDLKVIFKSLRISEELINRLILGNYTRSEEIHKRPMAKFMQDIGKEVGLIKT